MKKYAFLTPTLSDMGGAQMYLRNKVLFLKNNGWDVFVFAALASNVVLPELREFDGIYPELNFNRFEFSRRTRNRVTASILRHIGKKDQDEMIVESTGIVSGTWGEKIAEATGARHLLFILQERNIIFNKGLQRFLVFKHQRLEIAGITKKTIKECFLPFCVIPEEESYRLGASCNNVEADVDHPLLHQIQTSRYDYIVGCLSRLDKPFIMPTISSFCEYANKYIHKRFLLMLIGGAPVNTSFVERIKTIVARQNNIELLLTGYIYPVPIKLMEMCDVFLSSAGSSRVCMRTGIPTITIDANDYQPIGVLGRDTNNLLFRGEDEPVQRLDTLLDKILVRKEYDRALPSYKSGVPDFSSHIDFLHHSKADMEYYDVESLFPETNAEKQQRLVLLVLGAKVYNKIRVYKISKWIKHIICD